MMKTNELNDIVKQIFDTGVTEMKVLEALHKVNESNISTPKIAWFQTREKDRIKTLIYRNCLIEKGVITEHADNSYTYCNEHDAVMTAMDKYSKYVKKGIKKRMFEFIGWLQSYAELVYDKEKMEVMWSVEVETHITDLMTVYRAYKYWKHNVKGKY